MAEAARLKDVPDWKKEAEASRLAEAKMGVFKKKKFSELNAEEKDQLLELVSVRLGLIQSSK